MKKFALTGAFALVVACSQGSEAPEPEGTDLASQTGAVLVTTSDGAKVLAYSLADGTMYGGPAEGDGTPATWAVEGDKTCIDPPGDEEKFCFSYGPVAADGSVPVIDDDGQAVSFRPLGATPTPGATPTGSGSGASIVTFEDGSTGLSVFTADGKAYLARNPQQGTWRAADGKRCIKMPADAAETCSTPGEPGADGSFTATNDAGQTITVQPLA